MAKTRHGHEVSEVIQFTRGLLQGDALCPRLFTLCINPVAWKLSAAEGYHLSRPASTSVTHLLYIGNLKVFTASLFTASQSKLDRVLYKSTQEAMQDGLQWNPTIYVLSSACQKRGACD